MPRNVRIKLNPQLVCALEPISLNCDSQHHVDDDSEDVSGLYTSGLCPSKHLGNHSADNTPESSLYIFLARRSQYYIPDQSGQHLSSTKRVTVMVNVITRFRHWKKKKIS